MINRKLLLAGMAVAIMTLSGCANTKAESKATLSVRIQADQNINPNWQGKASSVDIRIYQLTSPSLFNEADFFNLYPTADKTLGDSYIKMTEVLIAPGKTIKLQVPLSPDTEWFGVLAAFSDINATRWSATAPLRYRWWGRTSLSILVHQSKLDIKE